MRIPNKIMLKRERGDIMAIVAHSKFSRPTITKAIKSGHGSRKVVNAIVEFYKSI